MRRRAIVLWAGFALVLCMVCTLLAAVGWFILGPYGPPLPWRSTAQPTPATPTAPPATITPPAGSTASPAPTAVRPSAGLPTVTPPPATPVPPSPSTAQPSVAPPPSLPAYPSPTTAAGPTLSPTPATAQPTPPSTQPTAQPTPSSTPATAQPTPPSTPATAGPTTPPTQPTPEPTATASPVASDGSETARRLAEATIPPRDLVELTGRLLNGGRPLPRTATPDPQPFTIGREDRFWVFDSAIDAQREIVATLLYITPHLYMYVEKGTAVDPQALESAALAFEDKIYSRTREAFGSEWTPGVDGDPHITVLHAHFGEASGYFYSLNEVPRQVNPYSNQREMFCMSLDELEIGSDFYLSTLAHEFQHMIQWNQDPQSETWTNEGLAQMSEYINDLGPGDYGWAFLSAADLQLTTWYEDPADELAHYAAAYLWSRYLYDRTGAQGAFHQLLNPQVDDFAAVEQSLQQVGYVPLVQAPRPFDAFFADWVVANYLNDSRVGDGRYAYAPEVNIAPVWATESVYTLPWNSTGTVHPYATDYIVIASPQQGTLNISFEGVATLPLVPTTPHSQSHFWWSNRGDMADSTLTRRFDLRGVSQATLRFWTWYDIEADYDYVYVEASTDGGTAWNILEGRYTTDTNPNGTNLGQGYTGKSGGGPRPSWVQEEIDLSRYAGQELLLRFEMVTDDAHNARGLALDDLEIPEIGFRDDMENAAGWEARGFVWVDNVVPARFLVQAITARVNGEKAVQQLPIDAQGRGALRLPGYGSDLAQVTLVISVVAPKTTEPAGYTVQLRIE